VPARTTKCLLPLLLVACHAGSAARPDARTDARRDDPALAEAISLAEAEAAGSGDDEPGPRRERPPVEAEPAPAPTRRAADVPEAATLARRIEGWFEDHAAARGYVQVDKPLYHPGETVWFRAWDLSARALEPRRHEPMRVLLVSPRGATVAERMVASAKGGAAGDFELGADLPGGEYVLRVHSQGLTFERPVIVSTYEAPRLKKKLEFLRKAYGEGDEVTATIEVKRPTGEGLAKRELACAVTLDGAELPRTKVVLDETGSGLVRFPLPARIAAGDGLLTVLVEDGGVTESISKRVPIVLRKVQLGFLPEGGKLVEGLESRLYFEAKNSLGKPADVEGRIVDDLGNAVATFRTYHAGLGRVSFTPGTGRVYKAEVTRPAGVTEQYALPLAEAEGCVLRTYDDPDSREPAIRARVACTQARRVVLAAMIRERPIDAAALDVAPGEPAVAHLASKDPKVARMQGVARVTLFDDKLLPLAERVVFRHRRGGLKLEVRPDREGYAPRDTVKLDVRASDQAGEPIEAELAVSVVDDTVVSFADDKTSHLFSKLLLDPEMPRKVEEPNFFFDVTEPKGALGLELLMGTWGHVQFAWREVQATEPDAKKRAAAREEARKREAERMRFASGHGGMGVRGAGRGGGGMRAMAMEAAAMPPPMAVPMAAAPALAPPRPGMAVDDELDRFAEVVVPGRAKEAKAMAEANPVVGGRARLDVDGRFNRLELAEERLRVRDLARQDGLADRMMERRRPMPPAQLAPVRVFPVPAYVSGEFSGPRSDFRETVYWNPSVQTGKDGRARVSFPLSDAVTSFRVFAEGTGGGLLGREETVLKSSLPFSLSVKLPTEVSAGDRIRMPLSLANERTGALDVAVEASFGDGLRLAESVEAGGRLAAGGRRSAYYPLEVSAVSGKVPVRIRASTGSLTDEVARELVVTPLGFPQAAEFSGQAKPSITHEVELSGAVPGTVEGRLTFYPSPVASMTSGLEGMLREPSGCFEQTSSTNYPNVMVMQYLREHQVADAALLERSSRLLDGGYKRLVGYETPQKGYEWFGGAPAHEALTAYGLVEFDDMRKVYGGVDEQMLKRTADWLKGRRDGKGGYLRDAKALDSFGRASPEVTDAYVTWSLALVGTPGIDRELDAQAAYARDGADAYRLALATHALLVTPARRAPGLDAAKRLAALQDKDGAFSKADHSITRSSGQNLAIEATSLAVLALLEAGRHAVEVRRAVEWLDGHRGGFGAWGATQATVLALKAMTAYAKASRVTQAPGKVTVLVDGRVAASAAYEAGRREPLVLDAFAKGLAPGKHRIELRHEGAEGLPYTLAVTHRAATPASAPGAVVGLETSIARARVKMGETVRVEAVVKNRTDKGQPMALARVGIPAGLSFQTWQLKELKDKGVVAFWETQAREVVLYFRDLKPSEEKRVPIDLVATVPGHYTAPASSAYLYYTNDQRTWAPALVADVEP
jgi:hypothetical protein